MEKINKKLIALFLGLAVLLGWGGSQFGASSQTNNCVSYVHAATVVGGDAAVNLSATSSRRLWIEVRRMFETGATSSVYIALNGLTAATSTGFALSSSTPMTFGLNNPYNGQVSARASHGSTTVMVSSCVY